MGVRAHVNQMNIKREDLDREITSELKRLHPDTLRISQLKKEKLQLKDRVTTYQTPEAS